MFKVLHKWVQHNRRKQGDLMDETWIIRYLKPDVFIDIGANTGQFSGKARRRGFKGLVIALEPVSHLFEKLVTKNKSQKNWINIQKGVSDTAGETEIYVCDGHGGTSSILQPTRALTISSGTTVTHTETIQVCTVDEIIAEHAPNSDNIYIKVDVQGLELKVMQGLEKYTHKVLGCRLEMAIDTTDYENQPNMWDIITYMDKRGFGLVDLEPTWRNYNIPTKDLLYMDGVFLNRNKVV